MSGVGGPRGAAPDFSGLDHMIRADASGLKVEEGLAAPRGESSLWMAFKSGINRLFGFKSDSDATANQASLRAILDYVEQQGGRAVREHVENGVLQLGGDATGTRYTVADRLERGTYVSSSVVAQIKALAEQGAARGHMTVGQFVTDEFRAIAQPKLDGLTGGRPLATKEQHDLDRMIRAARSGEYEENMANLRHGLQEIADRGAGTAENYRIFTEDFLNRRVMPRVDSFPRTDSDL